MVLSSGRWRLFVHGIALLPLGSLLADAALTRLGTDPVAVLTHRSGDWALRFLLACLAMTPLRRLTGAVVWIQYRRMLGLHAFVWASLHLAVYLLLDLQGWWSQIFSDIVRRPFITVGFCAWLLLLPLALTSNRSAMRRLGKNWMRLHRLAYVAAVLAVLHYLWLVRADLRDPLLYATMLAVSFLLRLRPGVLRAPVRTGGTAPVGGHSSDGATNAGQRISAPAGTAVQR